MAAIKPQRCDGNKPIQRGAGATEEGRKLKRFRESVYE